jgi:hypothetical protein
LTASSPARGSGSTANCSATDLLGTSMQQAGVCDQGAYGLFDGEKDTRPLAPISVSVL